MQSGGCECRIWRVYLWTCAGSLLSCVVGVVALASPSWTEGRYGKLEYLQTGIMLFCHHRNSEPHARHCAPLVFGSEEEWFEAVRLLSVLSWVFLFTVLVMSPLLHFQDESFAFFLPTVILGLVAGVLGLVGVIIFAIPWTTRQVLAYYDVSLSWGYVVYVIWHVITLVVFFLILFSGRHICYSRFKIKRHH